MPDFSSFEIIEAGPGHIEALSTLFDDYRVFYKQPSDVVRAGASLPSELRKASPLSFWRPVSVVAIGKRWGSSSSFQRFHRYRQSACGSSTTCLSPRRDGGPALGKC